MGDFCEIAFAGWKYRSVIRGRLQGATSQEGMGRRPSSRRGDGAERTRDLRGTRAEEEGLPRAKAWKVV